MKPKRPISRACAAASRANGAKSRGPASMRGKFNSSRNALIHGSYARIHTLDSDRQLGSSRNSIFSDASRQVTETTGQNLSGSLGSPHPDANPDPNRRRPLSPALPGLAPTPQKTYLATNPQKLLKTMPRIWH